MNPSPAHSVDPSGVSADRLILRLLLLPGVHRSPEGRSDITKARGAYFNVANDRLCSTQVRCWFGLTAQISRRVILRSENDSA